MGLGAPYTLNNEQYTPFGYGNVPPRISLFSPMNQTYNESSVPLVFSVDKPFNWTGFGLDGQPNVNITGNTTLTAFSDGLHNITIYSNDTFSNMVASETATFKVAKIETEPFPTATIAVASGASAVIVVAGLVVYFKKRKR